MPTWNFHGNLPTVLVYTWICSRHDLRAAVLPDRNDALRRKNGEEVVRLLVEQEVALVGSESLHGRLLRLETSTIDLFTIDATLRESSGIYFNASQEEQRLECQREEERSDPQSLATGVVTDWLEHHLQHAWPLIALGEACRDDLADMARALSQFFQGHCQLALRNRAFFVGECVRLALEQVEWNTVAAFLRSLSAGKSAEVPYGGPASCETGHDPGVQLALFRQLLLQTSHELSEWGARPGLPREFLDLALYLGDLCRNAAQVDQGLAS